MKAVIYARYSSNSQREESIEGQLRECATFAEKNGITVQVRFRQKEAHRVPQEARQERMDRGFGGR